MLKAIREAKVHTSWSDQHQEYEQAAVQFVRELLRDSASNPFLDDFLPFQRRVSFFGALNSLSQTLLKLTAPGVPDIYQGSELWDFSLVDPDNRRPVDFEMRRRLLREIQEEGRGQRAEGCDANTKHRANTKHQSPGRAGPNTKETPSFKLQTSSSGPEKAESAGSEASSALPISDHISRFTYDLSHRLLKDSPAAKLYLIWRTLGFRRTRRELFESGDYVPIEAAGPRADHVCAFSRSIGGEKALVVVPRLVVGLTGGPVKLPFGDEVWSETTLRLPDGAHSEQYLNVLTDEIIEAVSGSSGPRVRLGEILRSFPVAMLEPTETTNEHELTRIGTSNSFLQKETKETKK
jgi:(1->4)-alpha-D-glucan 1-alpha-D-glucosylmutase